MSDEFDNIPDEFAGIDDANWNEILSCPDTHPLHAQSPSTSSIYSWDDLDDDVLAQLDTLEYELTQQVSGPAHPTGASNFCYLRPFSFIPSQRLVVVCMSLVS